MALENYFLLLNIMKLDGTWLTCTKDTSKKTLQVSALSEMYKPFCKHFQVFSACNFSCGTIFFQTTKHPESITDAAQSTSWTDVVWKKENEDCEVNACVNELSPLAHREPRCSATLWTPPTCLRALVQNFDQNDWRKEKLLPPEFHNEIMTFLILALDMLAGHLVFNMVKQLSLLYECYLII